MRSPSDSDARRVSYPPRSSRAVAATQTRARGCEIAVAAWALVIGRAATILAALAIALDLLSSAAG